MKEFFIKVSIFIIALILIIIKLWLELDIFPNL